MTNEMKAQIAAMQTKRAARPTIWQNSNGTFSHHRDSARGWADRSFCETDLRFTEEWAR